MSTKNSQYRPSGLIKSTALVILFAVLGLCLWSFVPKNTLSPSLFSQKASFDESSGVVDIMAVKKELIEIKEQQSQTVQQFYEQEKELAIKDQKAQELIDRLQQQPGMSEDEFQQHYGELLGSVSK